MNSLRQLTAEARRGMGLRQRIRNYTDSPTLREVVYREAHKRASAALLAWVNSPSAETREEFIRATEALEVAERANRVAAA